MARRAGEQWGVLATAELLECGMTHAAISRRARRGWLHQLHTGVWAVGHANPPIEGRLLAAVKACGAGALLSHHSAAVHWGLLDPSDRYPHVTVRGPRTRILPEIIVHRTATLEPIDRTRLRRVPVTAPARTVLDLAAVVSPDIVRSVVRRGQGLGRVNVRQLVDVLDRLGPRRGSRSLAQAVATGPAPTRSVLEDVVLDLLLSAGFAHPDVNKPITIAGRRVIPDFRWPGEAVVVEADGAAWHEGRIAREDDTERQALLESHGQRVIRVTWNQAMTRRAETIARIRAAGVPDEPESRLASPIRKRVDGRPAGRRGAG
ncbi:MAG: type IV toxin-antitoxin system AbiEi family antitoxin domain-containing protein [Gaiellaceae bacterium MAG52_C11]|nr:type IV toxin-antitoxin system AbiEi family antitoxin domain-containing protein [Candidatus Gaiellasilicea maunaloa]